MLTVMFLIWLGLMIIGGIGKAVSNSRKRQALLDDAYARMQASKEPDD